MNNQLSFDRDNPQALFTSDSNEWYTPAEYVEGVRRVLGEIELDPASCEIANRIVKARKIYTIEDNGLLYPWAGKVFLNPPYGFVGREPNKKLWSHRLIQQYEAGITTEAIMLLNAATSEKWFQPMWKYTVCLTDHRIRFYRPDGPAMQPTKGNAFVYLGKDPVKFARVFSRFGAVLQKIEF